MPFSAHSGVGSDSCFAGSSLSCPLRNIEDTGDGERSEALSTIAFAMRMQELVAQYAEGVFRSHGHAEACSAAWETFNDRWPSA